MDLQCFLLLKEKNLPYGFTFQKVRQPNKQAKRLFTISLSSNCKLLTMKFLFKTIDILNHLKNLRRFCRLCVPRLEKYVALILIIVSYLWLSVSSRTSWNGR